MSWFTKKRDIPDAADALPGRDTPLSFSPEHLVTGRSMVPPYPSGYEQAVVGMGCFWGAERLFWTTPGVWVTAVGYAGGSTPNPTYEEVCSGRTGHTEAVLVVFDPAEVTYEQVLKVFWEGHDPTQGMGQGNDVGTQYRSAVYTYDAEQQRRAEATRDGFAPVLHAAHYGDITTEIAPLTGFYFAEGYHQQYLHRVPNGYCGLSGTGTTCPVGVIPRP